MEELHTMTYEDDYGAHLRRVTITEFHLLLKDPTFVDHVKVNPVTVLLSWSYPTAVKFRSLPAATLVVAGVTIMYVSWLKVTVTNALPTLLPLLAFTYPCVPAVVGAVKRPVLEIVPMVFVHVYVRPGIELL